MLDLDNAVAEGINNKIKVSRPEEFHLQPLSEPDVRLSTHPAPIIPARTALFRS
ncbi:MAG: hypothetical protein ACYCSA_03440 [Thermoplasmataceae archaeon]